MWNGLEFERRYYYHFIRQSLTKISMNLNALLNRVVVDLLLILIKLLIVNPLGVPLS
jgi:hypothetical protein